MKTVEVNNSVWTEERILNIIIKSDEQMIRAMMKIYDYQTIAERRIGGTTEHNGVGFTGVDGTILSSFCDCYIKYRRLTERQMVIVRKKMPKYVKQLLKIIAIENGSEIKSIRKPRLVK